jgi:hypothetical protein
VVTDLVVDLATTSEGIAHCIVLIQGMIEVCPSYHPQGDSQVERTDREVVDQLILSGSEGEWDYRSVLVTTSASKATFWRTKLHRGPAFMLDLGTTRIDELEL